MPTFINSTVLANGPVNLDHIISIEKQDITDVAVPPVNEQFRLIFTKADQNGAGTPIVWLFDTAAARNACYTAIDVALITSY